MQIKDIKYNELINSLKSLNTDTPIRQRLIIEYLKNLDRIFKLFSNYFKETILNNNNINYNDSYLFNFTFYCKQKIALRRQPK